MIFNGVLERIERGRNNLNKGLPMGFNRLVEYIPDIQQGTYYLVGAESSVGKTAFVDNCFLFNPYDHLRSTESNIRLKVIYFSLEIDKTVKIAKAVCRKLFTDYNLVTDVNYILSRGKNRISDEVYNLVRNTRDYFEGLEDVLEIIDANENPTGIWNHLMRYSNTVGSWEGNTYTPNDPNLYTIIIIDHIGLMKRERGYTKKENIDKMSEYAIILRNKCNFIPVFISQFNRAISSADRFKIERVEPQSSDFKDTSNLFEDCNVCMALFSPARYEIPEFRGYNTKHLKNSFRSLHILKNRDGESDKVIGLNFVGAAGFFEEMPRATEVNQEYYKKLESYRFINREVG